MQKQVNSISVAGFNTPLSVIPKKELKGGIADDIVRFSFYRAEFAGTAFVLLVSIWGVNETPANCSIISDRLSSVLSLPIVYYFFNLKFYERRRYIEKSVFFITKRGEFFCPT